MPPCRTRTLLNPHCRRITAAPRDRRGRRAIPWDLGIVQQLRKPDKLSARNVGALVLGRFSHVDDGRRLISVQVLPQLKRLNLGNLIQRQMVGLVTPRLMQLPGKLLARTEGPYGAFTGANRRVDEVLKDVLDVVVGVEEVILSHEVVEA